MKKAFITGLTGQDGSYLAEFLLEKGYEVHAIVRPSTFTNSRLNHLFKELLEKDENKLNLIYGDMEDTSTITDTILKIQPDEVYNLAAQSHVRISFDMPEYTGSVVGLGATRVLQAIKTLNDLTGKKAKFYQASTSEMFGKAVETPQKETTPFYPRSPYGVAKLYAYWMTVNFRESYGIFACNGILFNHESSRRGENFVTRKITHAIARIKEGSQKVLYLGNLDAKRDWGHAKDYVEAMWLMLQQEKPDDYVISTGETHSVREFLEECFKVAGIQVESNGKSGIEEEYIRKDNGEAVVKIDPKYYRPAEVELLLGDSSKAHKVLNWKPKVLFKDLVKEMYDKDYDMLQKEIHGTKK